MSTAVGPGRGRLSQAFHRVTSPPPVPTRDLGADWEPRSHQERTNSGDAFGDALRSGLFRICAGDLPGQAVEEMGPDGGWSGGGQREWGPPIPRGAPEGGQHPYPSPAAPLRAEPMGENFLSRAGGHLQALGSWRRPRAPPVRSEGPLAVFPVVALPGPVQNCAQSPGIAVPPGWVDAWASPGERSAHAAEPRSPGLNKVR